MTSTCALAWSSRNRRNAPATGAAVDRLAAVFALVPTGARVADIGTDHALLPRLLVDGGRASYCVGVDRSPQALERPRRVLRQPRLELRLGSGLEPLTELDAIDVVTLTGLGARTMVSVLRRDDLARVAPTRLVLQPQTEPGLLRRWLAAQGWPLVAETLVRHGRRFYVILAAERAAAPPPPPPFPLTTADLDEAGPFLVRSRSPLVRAYWRQEQERLAAVVRRRPRSAAARRLALAGRVLGCLPHPGTSSADRL